MVEENFCCNRSLYPFADKLLLSQGQARVCLSLIFSGRKLAQDEFIFLNIYGGWLGVAVLASP